MNAIPQYINVMSGNFDRLTEQLPLCRNSTIGCKFQQNNDDGVIDGYCVINPDGKRQNDCVVNGERSPQVDVDNLTDLNDKSDSAVAEYLKAKFLSQDIYIWAGQALLVLHPYCDVERETSRENKPSIDAVVAKAWFKLTNNLGKPRQCIVISGDSGSGKTYSGCLAIKYVAKKIQNSQKAGKNENILWQAWSHVPLLTAFGNASTMHNNNSSRFGKLLQMQYKNGKIIGAYVQTFMLEKSRVSGPNQGETNFHIFNQVLENIDPSTLAKIYIHKNIVYKICPPSDKSQHRVLYEETLKSMKLLQIARINEILKILSIILNLGNIEFINVYDKLTISNESAEHLHYCAKLLECDTTDLSRLLLKRLIAAKVRRVTFCYTSCLNTEECEERRNALMRYLYEKLFLWLVDCINQRTYCNEETSLLGILDIYGFESFKTNTFEQLCINYANERLQQYFVENYIANQMELLNEEFETPTYKKDVTEYRKRIALLDGVPSVFGILNEECLVKRYNTDVFICARLCNILKKYPHFKERNSNVSTTFTIVHYAGPVEYDSRTMVTKNRDKIPEEIVAFLKECKFHFISHTLVDDFSNDGPQGKTLLTKFKRSLDKLMNMLNESDVHYIKCLKPNLHQVSGCFDENYVISQLKYNGIMDILGLGLQKYSYILSFDEFRKKFHASDRILEAVTEALDGKIYVGKRIYLSETGYRKLIAFESYRQHLAALTIQNIWKRYRLKRERAAKIIQRFFHKIMVRRNEPSEERVIDLSWKQSSTSVPSNKCDKDSLKDMSFSFTASQRRTEQYVDNLKKNFSGDPISLKLEKLLESISTKPFRRPYFRKDHIVTNFKLLELPLRIHIKKTCLPHIPIVPRTELPQGLTDIF